MFLGIFKRRLGGGERGEGGRRKLNFMSSSWRDFGKYFDMR